MSSNNLLLFPEMAGYREEPPAAPSTTARVPDWEARETALNIGQSFVVEAPAGSGKTALLIQRFLKLLSDPEVERPEQVLALTFTRKAAGEMRDRVLSELVAAHAATDVADGYQQTTRLLAQAVLRKDEQLGWSLLAQPHRLNLRTIDSLASEIARSLPVLSGSGGALSPTENAAALYREAARRTLLQLGAAGPEDDPLLDRSLRDLLLHRDNNLMDCESLIANMLAVREQWAGLVPLDRHALTDERLDRELLPQMERTLQHAIERELASIVALFPADALEELTRLAEEMSYSEGYGGAASPIIHCRGVHRCPGLRAADIDHWRALIHLVVKPSKPRGWRKSLSKNVLRIEIEARHKTQLTGWIERIAERDDLLTLLCRVDELPPPHYPHNQWTMIKSLFRVLRRALIELQLVFAARGECDFPETSLLARAALQASGGANDLAAAQGAGLRHLLVDEMQDTSSGQYELLTLLTQSWDGYSQTVFLVGDPRQSIYLFRQARVERFVETLREQRLGDLPLTALRLRANFRSQRGLLEACNRDFALVFGESTDAEAEMPYTPAAAVLANNSSAQGLQWHADPVVLPSAGTADEDAPSGPRLRERQRRHSSRRMAELVQRWSRQPLPARRTDHSKPWRIAVLVRSRNHLAEVTREFRNAGIAFRAVEIEPLAERQEILDLTALTRALLHPADRIAGLALLRAPWCGLPLAELHRLTGEDDPDLKSASVERLIEQRGDLLTEESCTRLRRVWSVLHAAAAARGTGPFAARVERAWHSLGGEANLTEEQMVNARRFFELLDELEGEHGAQIELTALMQRLERLYAEPQRIPPGSVEVELMTMHRAKGLEWDVVIVPGLERSPGKGHARLLLWAEMEQRDHSASFVVAPIAARGEAVDRLSAWLRGIQRAHEAAERKRLFYVAATRAREELHLFASPDLTAKGSLQTAWDSLLKSAWPAALPHLETAQLRLLRTAGEAPQPAGAADTEESQEPATFDLAASAEVIPMRATGGFEGSASEAIASAHDPLAIAEQASLYQRHEHPPIERLPASYNPEERFAAAHGQRLRLAGDDLPSDSITDAAAAGFQRPHGSFAARAFGNAVHAILELTAERLARNSDVTLLRAEVGTWHVRAQAMLRGEGISPNEAGRMAQEAVGAVIATLNDAHGSWLLRPHAQAHSEFEVNGLVEATQTAGQRAIAIRVDRTFCAGPEPGSEGNDTVWVVDFKTASHGMRGLETFLNDQRRSYAAQLELYGDVLARSRGLQPRQVRLGLYYPLLPRLVWWSPGQAAAD